MGLETLAIVAIAASVAAGGVAAYSSYQQGQAAKDQAKYEAKVNSTNQIAAQHQADFELAQMREKYRKIRGTQTAAAASSGLGSSLLSEVYNNANMQEDLDTLGLLYSARTNAVALQQRSQLSNMRGKQGAFEGNLGAASSILSTAGDVYGAYPTLSQ